MWLIECPWIMCNGSGIDYHLFSGTLEEVSQIIPNYSLNPEGSNPKYNDDVRIYKVEVKDPGTIKSLDFLRIPFAAEPQELIEEFVHGGEYCFVDIRSISNFGCRSDNLVDLEIYKKHGTNWMILHLVKQYRWNQPDMF